MTAFHEKLNGTKAVAQLDLGLYSGEQNAFFDEALHNGALLNSTIYPRNSSNSSTGVLSQSVNGSQRVYLDLLQQAGRDVLTEGLKVFNNHSTDVNVSFHGLWLEHNEPYADCDGECPASDASEQESAVQSDVTDAGWYHSYQDQSAKSTFALPFIPGKLNLDKNTLSLNGTHPSSGVSQYNTHSLMGHMQGKTTFEGMSNLTVHEHKRKFVVSKSTFAGSGQFVGHDLGQGSGWEWLSQAITGVANFNLFGIPLTGPRVCGTLGDSDSDELCAREL